MLDFLLAFYDKFPEYKGRPLYITGEVMSFECAYEECVWQFVVQRNLMHAWTESNIHCSHMVGTTYPPSALASWPTTVRAAQRSAST